MGSTLRRALLDVAFFAILLRALLPAGWMPGHAADGTISFVICSVDGVHRGDGDGHANKTGDDGRQHDACPFAAAPHVATPVTAAQIAPPSHAVLDEASFAFSHAAPQSAIYLPQSPRAPPISA